MEGDGGREEETKICSNCKRDIPLVNFLVHSVHCARNIRPCATCKEPVPLTDLQDHHDRLHKLQPCKACGERVCGSDLEDHVRDSCGSTVRPCRYCELELPRKKLPNHESYCGSRTEQCADCQEWVQIKYRQLHLDSNHGFIKLDDEPPPIPQLARPHAPRPTSGANRSQPNTPKSPTSANASKPPHDPPQLTPNGSTINGLSNTMKQTNLQNEFLKPLPNASTSNYQPSCAKNEARSSSNGAQESRSAVVSNSLVCSDGLYGRSGLGVRPKRNNDQPQVNTSVAGASKVKDSSPHGAIKKRPAPKPPTQCPQRDSALKSALARHREEEAERREQNVRNAAMGLPPVLSAAEKLEKLRKLDALQNRVTDPPDYSNRLRGQCWTIPDFAPQTHVLGREGHGNNPRDLGNNPRDLGNNPRDPGNNLRDFGSGSRDPGNNTRDFGSGSRDPGNNPRDFGNSPRDPGHNLQDLQPMTQEEFLQRFQEIHDGRRDGGRMREDSKRMSETQEFVDRLLGTYDGRQAADGGRMTGDSGRMREDGGRMREDGGRREDRFSEIKSSLRELRRGLNEVTAPYNTSGNPNNNGSAGAVRRPSAAATPQQRSDDDVRLPCEFCDVLVPREDLVLHQTGCRPDLVAYSPRPSPARSPSPRPRTDPSRTDPVIPCEFCAEPLPVYLINEHQERCRRENDQLYLD